MGECVRIRAKHKKICLGDLTEMITLQVRSIKPLTGEVDFTENFSQNKDVWAMVETKPDESIFDEVNIERSVSHFFYIRYVSNVTFENWILYKDKRYDLLSVENFDERNEFYLLKASVRGDKDKKANLV